MTNKPKISRELAHLIMELGVRHIVMNIWFHANDRPMSEDLKNEWFIAEVLGMLSRGRKQGLDTDLQATEGTLRAFSFKDNELLCLDRLQSSISAVVDFIDGAELTD